MEEHAKRLNKTFTFSQTVLQASTRGGQAKQSRRRAKVFPSSLEAIAIHNTKPEEYLRLVLAKGILQRAFSTWQLGNPYQRVDDAILHYHI